MNLWRGLIQTAKDCLFPIFCLECQSEGQWWCEACLAKQAIDGVFYCPVCHNQNSNGHPCNECKAASSLNGVAAFLNYEDQEAVGQLIKQFKYHFAFDIIDVWGKMVDLFLIDIIKQMDIGVDMMTVIPVPLYISRERQRGFNQADLVAKLIFKNLSTWKQADFDNRNLQRKKETNQQAKLNRTERFKNLKDAFVWSGQKNVPKNILLIDDVYTSGATMQECARVLKKCGAQKVYGFTLARD